MQTMPLDESQCNDRLSKAFNWRDHLKVHPAAELFPLLPPDELQALADDIKKSGLRTSIVLTWGDMSDAPLLLLDGRNRLDALALLGWLGPPRERARHESVEKYKRYVQFHPLSIGDWDDENCFVPEQCFEIANGDPYDLVLSLNVHRRHLTAEQKRELIAKVLKAHPELSNRQIGNMTKADHHKVADVRSKLESTGEVSPVQKTVGADGKARKVATPEAKALAALKKQAKASGHRVRQIGTAFMLADGNGAQVAFAIDLDTLAKKISEVDKPTTIAAPVDGDADSSAQARKDHYAAADNKAPDPQEEEDRKTYIARPDGPLKTKQKSPRVSKDEALDRITGVNVPDAEWLEEKFLEMVESINADALEMKELVEVTELSGETLDKFDTAVCELIERWTEVKTAIRERRQ